MTLFCQPRTGNGDTMNSGNIKRSIVRNGQKTSVSLEQEFWEALREIASSQNAKLTTLVQKIDEGRAGSNLSSAIRVFVFNHLRSKVAGAEVGTSKIGGPQTPAQDRRAVARPTTEPAFNC
jgi:predicted DNA-binding ribbon-helix-helix protein